MLWRGQKVVGIQIEDVTEKGWKYSTMRKVRWDGMQRLREFGQVAS